MIAIIRRIH